MKTVFTAEEAGSRRVVVTHGQGHHRSRLQPEQRSWGSPFPRKLKPGVTKSSSWLKQRPAPLGRQLAVFQLPELRHSPVVFPFQLAGHTSKPTLLPSTLPWSAQPTLGDLQSFCGGAPQEPQQQLLSAACNYTPGKSLIYGA